MEHISLSELARRIKLSLSERVPLPVWVSAEIGEIKVNRTSGHCYMELVESGGGSVPKAKISAVAWRTQYGAMAAHFRSVTGSDLSVGLSVLLKVVVTFHELYGLSLQVVDIEPAYTLGEQERLRRETIERLTKEGVIDMNRSLSLPMVVQRVAVISSAQAAGYRDFMEHIAASPYGFKITLFESLMQGLQAADSVVAALAEVAERAEEFDAVVVIRGGGSQSDLSCFNSYELCYVAAQMPLPIITGIGHDKDTSVMDLVACVEQKTPTAVADFLVDRMREFDGWLAQTEVHLSQRVADVVARSRSEIASREELLSMAVGHIFERRRDALLRAEMLVAASDPKSLLSRGYAIVRGEGGVVQGAKVLRSGSKVEIIFADGSVTATIDEVKLKVDTE
ncbi:MAG: exodeoxyribonuclease VII large subunit [Tidjanibacter sp.]|nr:exodeoxyribonuclease VII large subunit [Tidjanibacter sp.]